MLRAMCVVGVTLLFTPLGVAQQRELLRKNLVGKAPPELVALEADWLAGPPTNFASLKGKVVWLQFNFWENCTSFRRHLVRWEADYAERGLVIVEVSGGELATFADSARRLAKTNIKHPVIWDRNNSLHKAYGVQAWPVAFLIGADGTVFWQGNPALMRGKKDEEKAFREMLEAHLRRATAKAD